MTNSKFIQTLIVSSLFLVILALGGCIGDDDEDIVTPDYTPIQPDTTNVLMEHFEASYTDMLITDFEEILHDDFKLILTFYTLRDWGLAPGTIVDRDQMLTIHENMFGAFSGIDASGNNINPLDHIEVIIFDRMTSWAEVPLDDSTFPGSSYARYSVRLKFHDNTGTHAFEVDQQIIFYADQVGEYWYLSGISPIGNYAAKAVESASYDGTIYLYNTVPD